MPSDLSSFRLIVKSVVRLLPQKGFSFEAWCDRRALWCVNSGAFEGELPDLRVGDEIIVEIGPETSIDPDSVTSPVLYLTKVDLTDAAS